jgi:putative drug exporter of the RND superfamily
MSNLLYRWGRAAARHPWRMIAAWLIVALAVVGLRSAVGGETSDNFRIPNTEAQDAIDLLDARFPSQGGSSGQVVFATNHGTFADPANRAAVEKTLAALASGDKVLGVTNPFDPAAPTVNPDGTVAFSIIRYSVDPPGSDQGHAAIDAADVGREAGIQVELSKTIVSTAQQPEGREGIGLIVAVVVLIVAFGSLIAAGIPIGSAIFGIFIGLSLIGVLAGFADVPSISPLLATMIGLGVGIDYALFVVTRHRGFLRAGRTVEESAALANATSGSAVLFAGVTVVIALAGLRVAGIPAIATMGLASAIGVAVAMVAAVTLLPALLGLAGTKIDRFHIGRRSTKNADPSRTFSARWAHRIGERPWRYTLVSLVGLLVAAVPVLSMRTGIADDGVGPTSTTYRKAYDLIADGFGEGFNGPLTIVVDGPSAAADAAAVQAAVQATPGIAMVTDPLVNPTGDTAVVSAIPLTSPQDEATTQLVHTLRDNVLPSVLPEDAHGYVTGQTASFVDISERLSDRLPLFIGVVIGLSFLLLLVVFRSVLVPLKAAVMNLLSIGAAYGAVVAVFQWGWGNSFLGVNDTVPISPFLPMIMFAVLFGLSMDYEVFLLSRVREEYVRTGDSRRSVVDGLAATARVITSAALIMISVFASFLLVPDVEIKMFAVGLTVAVLVDATVVRMVLVPATMELMGNANWWLPSWLDRVLPHIDVEGGKVAGGAVIPAHAGAETAPDDADGEPEFGPDRELEPVG